MTAATARVHHRVAPVDVFAAASVVASLLVLAIYVGYFVIYLAYARSLLAFPFDYDQGEGFELYDAIRLASGQNIYLDNAAFPFYSSNYPPVYRLMLVPLIWLFGPHIWVGRAVTFACSLVIGLFIFLAARRVLRRETLPRRSGAAQGRRGWETAAMILAPLLAASAFFAANYVYYIGPLARAHIPMVMFAFAGIYFLERGLDDRRQTTDDRQRTTVVRRPWSVVLGVALLVVAGFTKLQAVDALAAGFAYLLIRNPKLCLKALLASALFTAAAVLVLNALSQGQFWLNVVLANVNEYSLDVTWRYYRQWFQLEGALIVCSVLYVAWDGAAAVRARSFQPLTIWSLYFVAGSAMGMLTGKWGAGPTYLVAAVAVSCVCTVGLLWRVAQRMAPFVWRRADHEGGGARHAAQYGLLCLLCAGVFLWQATLNVHLPTSGRLFGTVARLLGIPPEQSVYPPYPYYDVIGPFLLGHLLDPADTRNGWELARIARQAPGPVWSEEAMITLNAGKEVVTNPTQLLNLAKSNMLDTAEMRRMIRNKEFGAVILRAQFYPLDVLEEIGRNYRWATTLQMNGFDYQVLYPKDE